MERLKRKKEGRLGSGNNTFNKSDSKAVRGRKFPAPFNNSKLGVSDETYSAEGVKDLEVVTSGYVQKEDE